MRQEPLVGMMEDSKFTVDSLNSDAIRYKSYISVCKAKCFIFEILALKLFEIQLQSSLINLCVLESLLLGERIF